MDEYSDWLVFNTLNTNAGIKYDIVAAKVYAGYARKRRNNNSETLISTDRFKNQSLQSIGSNDSNKQINTCDI
ncbi:hypothetical protein QR98_0040370 [Sarcoptes scabiei]|uniref:Uncharacterized protein n=1 Tax=Sarcoptes scabiei TaxID=52283 RepID=A0A132A3K2_SARSC|nr:hypothetical protein QR98_0040370 [Sarcoptes scabiei]